MIATVLAAADAASAQEPPRRPGAERQVVVQLAYTLGEAHALHRLCAGPSDATWYNRMQRLEGEEASDAAGRAQLADAFNAGYAARQDQFPACSHRSRAMEHAIAQKGATLARQLANLDAPPEP